MKSIAKYLATGLLAVAAAAPAAEACSRVTYVGEDSLYVVGRSLDWRTPIPTNLYVYPRGVEKMSSDKPGAFSWTSKYGAVYAVGYDGGVTEGMNERGLVINGLFCKGTVYDNDSTVNLPPMSMAMFVAWLLDLNETTDEVVKVLEKHNFSMGGATFDGGTQSALHWGVTDRTGKSVIFEFDHGEIRIYDMGDVRAMTNDPNWPQMLAILNYWADKATRDNLPGSVISADRCVRANYFAHHVKATADSALGVNICRTLLENVSVPYTYEIEGSPNLSSTQWRSFSDVKNQRYYFDVVTNLGTFYIDLQKLDLYPGAPILKLDTSRLTEFAGCANSHLERNPGFKPMY